jgi:hypothetical protein
MEDDDHFTESPFDTERGIAFKYGRSYMDSKQTKVRDFEKQFKITLPTDFLDLIDDWCEGGFDGFYRVLNDAGMEVVWTHLMLMKVRDEHDHPEHDPQVALDRYRSTFFRNNVMKFFPFGEAFFTRKGDEPARGDGFLVFDLENAYAVRFAGINSFNVAVAPTFSRMMKESTFLVFG